LRVARNSMEAGRTTARHEIRSTVGTELNWTEIEDQCKSKFTKRSRTFKRYATERSIHHNLRNVVSRKVARYNWDGLVYSCAAQWREQFATSAPHEWPWMVSGFVYIVAKFGLHDSRIRDFVRTNIYHASHLLNGSERRLCVTFSQSIVLFLLFFIVIINKSQKLFIYRLGATCMLSSVLC
jgi:hypothetical protein